ncbi:MAG: nucleotidyltransferase substrate binding protein [Kiritimatiellaeota bacterium]|nr:nucleotidyltransferase substrate binding protein [Kiritimatiellota bacterium]
MTTGCRWIHLFENYKNALDRLRDAVQLSQQRTLSELEAQGLLKTFEFAHDLAWKLMRSYLIFQGYTTVAGPRDATRQAFQVGLIADGKGWMDMIFGCNKSQHAYDMTIVWNLIPKITSNYYDLFCQFAEKMNTIVPS